MFGSGLLGREASSAQLTLQEVLPVELLPEETVNPQLTVQCLSLLL